MAAAIRENIVDALSTMLASITVANGYRTEISTVRTSAEPWSEVALADFNMVGIIPQTEVTNTEPGIVRTSWSFDIYAYMLLTGSTEALHLKAVSDFATDIRKLLYNTNSGNLGVSGVHFVAISGQASSLASPEAKEEKAAVSVTSVMVRFQEAQAAA